MIVEVSWSVTLAGWPLAVAPVVVVACVVVTGVVAGVVVAGVVGEGVVVATPVVCRAVAGGVGPWVPEAPRVGVPRWVVPRTIAIAITSTTATSEPTVRCLRLP